MNNEKRAQLVVLMNSLASKISNICELSRKTIEDMQGHKKILAGKCSTRFIVEKMSFFALLTSGVAFLSAVINLPYSTNWIRANLLVGTFFTIMVGFLFVQISQSKRYKEFLNRERELDRAERCLKRSLKPLEELVRKLYICSFSLEEGVVLEHLIAQTYLPDMQGEAIILDQRKQLVDITSKEEREILGQVSKELTFNFQQVANCLDAIGKVRAEGIKPL